MCHLKFKSQLDVLLWDKELLAKFLISSGVSSDVIKVGTYSHNYMCVQVLQFPLTLKTLKCTIKQVSR